MSLLFNMLSRLVIAFLPRSKCLLIAWLQSPSALILEPPKIKSVTVSTVSPSICHEIMRPDAMIVSECWVLSQIFHFPNSLSSRGSLVLLHFLLSNSEVSFSPFLLAPAVKPYFVKAKYSRGSSSQCQTPGLGNLRWDSEPLLLWQNTSATEIVAVLTPPPLPIFPTSKTPRESYHYSLSTFFLCFSL